MTRIGGQGWFREVTAPTLLQPVENLKVSIRKDDRQRVVRAAALQIPSDIDATFSVEKARCVGDFMAGHCRRIIFRNEQE